MSRRDSRRDSLANRQHTPLASRNVERTFWAQLVSQCKVEELSVQVENSKIQYDKESPRISRLLGTLNRYIRGRLYRRPGGRAEYHKWLTPSHYAIRSDHCVKLCTFPVSISLTDWVRLITGCDVPHPIQLHPLFVLPFPLAPVSLVFGVAPPPRFLGIVYRPSHLPSPTNPEPVKRPNAVNPSPNPPPKWSHNCRRHRKRTRETYKGSTRTK
jgi:hypothetical protein